ncbi:MAG: hypothetical protein ACXWV9_10815, partial [Flavisolibacter sp.]
MKELLANDYERQSEKQKESGEFALFLFLALSLCPGPDFLPDCVTQAGNRHDRCGSQDFKSCVPEASGYQFHLLHFFNIELNSPGSSFNLRIKTEDFIFLIKSSIA